MQELEKEVRIATVNAGYIKTLKDAEYTRIEGKPAVVEAAEMDGM